MKKVIFLFVAILISVDCIPVFKTTVLHAQGTNPEVSLRNFLLLSNSGNHQRALPYAKYLVKYFRRRVGEGHPAYAEMLYNYAFTLSNLKKYDVAERAYRQSLKLFLRHHGRYNAKTAEAYKGLGALYLEIGKLYKSEKLYLNALSIRSRIFGEDSKLVGDILHDLGTTQSFIGKYEQAEENLKKSISILKRSQSFRYYWTRASYGELAGIFAIQEKYPEAIEIYKKLIKLSLKYAGKDKQQLVTDYINIGLAYLRNDQLNLAEKYIIKAAKTISNNYVPYRRKLSLSSGILSSLAELNLHRQKYAESEELAREALRVERKLFRKAATSYSTLILGLAKSYNGKYSQAEEILAEHLASQQQDMSYTNQELIPTLIAIGKNYLLKKEWRKSYNSYKNAERIWNKITASGSITYYQNRRFRKQIQNLFSGLSLAAIKMSDQDSKRFTHFQNQSYVASQKSDLQLASAALTQMAVRFNKRDTNLVALVRKHQDLLNSLNALDKELINALGSPSGKYNAIKVGNLRSEINNTKKIISNVYSRLTIFFPEYVDLANPEPLSIKQAQNLLETNETLVSYIFVDKKIHVWILTNKRVHWIQIPIREKRIANMIATLRRGLDKNACNKGRDLVRIKAHRRSCNNMLQQRFDLKLAHRLYKKLLGPVESLIRDKKHLMIVPSGPLSALPFQVLVTQKPPSQRNRLKAYKTADWLIKRHAITILPSVSSLRALRVFAKKGRAAKAYIGFGNPDFSCRKKRLPGKRNRLRVAGLQTRGYADYFKGRGLERVKMCNRIPPLPHTSTELKTIARSLKLSAKNLYLGRKANEATLKKLSATGRLDDYRIVHFATHAFVAGKIKGKGEPGLVLSLPAKPTRQNDGYLMASEAAQLKLNADWVVLSACDTAAGDKPGAQALSGLARAFFYAGARSLLVSHWPVEDRAAALLTTRTFANMRRSPGIGRSEALRRAMLSLINSKNRAMAHPSMWAPFFVVGEGGRR